MLDSTPTNADRAEWARLAVDAFEGPGGPFHVPGTEDLQTVIKDLMTNLCHLARRECGVTDVQHFVTMAANMHDIEFAEDDDGDEDELVRQYGWFLNECEDGTYQVKDFHGDPDATGPFETAKEALQWAMENPIKEEADV